MVDSAVSPDRWYDAATCRRACDELDRSLHFVRDAYFDVATLHYPHAHMRGFDRFAGVSRGPTESGY